MSPTLLEIVVAIVLVVVLWQIGLAIAPSVVRWFANLGRDVDDAATRALDPDLDQSSTQNTKEHSNGTHRKP